MTRHQNINEAKPAWVKPDDTMLERRTLAAVMLLKSVSVIPQNYDPKIHVLKAVKTNED